jgi:hypothetical protein
MTEANSQTLTLTLSLRRQGRGNRITYFLSPVCGGEDQGEGGGVQ